MMLYKQEENINLSNIICTWELRQNVLTILFMVNGKIWRKKTRQLFFDYMKTVDMGLNEKLRRKQGQYNGKFFNHVCWSAGDRNDRILG